MMEALFSLPVTQDCLLAFSRTLYDEVMLIVNNKSHLNEDEEYIAGNSHLNPRAQYSETSTAAEEKFAF